MQEQEQTTIEKRVYELDKLQQSVKAKNARIEVLEEILGFNDTAFDGPNEDFSNVCNWRCKKCDEKWICHVRVPCKKCHPQAALAYSKT